MLTYSFFSYKGGSGRSSLVYNILPFLAEELHATNTEPIVVVDLDIDSKGLSFLLKNNDDKKVPAFNSIQVLRNDASIDFSMDETDITKHPFFTELAAVGYEVGLSRSEDMSVVFLTANATSEKNEYLSDNNNYDATDVRLANLWTLCNDMGCKALVLDLPAGGQLAGKAALEISDKIITTMRITKQFREGTYEFLSKKDSDGSINGKEFVIVPNAVPDPDSEIISEYLNEIETNVKEILHNNSYNLAMLTDGQRGINEVTLFKFREANLMNEKRSREWNDDEVRAINAYKLLAKELAKENA